MNLGRALEDLSEQMASAAAVYEPGGMLEWSEDIRYLETALRNVERATSILAYGVDQLPAHKAIKDALDALIRLQSDCTSTAGEIWQTFATVHGDELRRLQAPRPGEQQWDLQQNTQSSVSPLPALLHRQAVCGAVAARLPDKEPDEKYDTTARLQLTDDTGWSQRSTAAASRALRLYRCATFRAIGAYLRRSGDYVPEPMRIRELPDAPVTYEDPVEHVAHIDDIMDAAPLAAPVQLWRGVDGRAVFGDRADADLTGTEWVERSFPSTSTDPHVALVFASDVVLRLHVPAGIGAVQLSGRRSQDRHNSEAEVLLQRGLRMRVISDRTEPVGDHYIDFDFSQENPRWKTFPARTNRVLDVVVTPPPDEADDQ